MNLEEMAYLDLIKSIIDTGFEQNDRTGVGTFAKHGMSLRFNLRNNKIPLITTRKSFFRGAVEELIWLLRGETDASILQNKDIHIWDGNTTKDFIEKRKLRHTVPENDIGTLYGFQIRNWGGDYIKWRDGRKRTGVDQLKRLIDGINKEPESRRHLISNYNVSQLDTGVLEPCHTLYGFTVDKTNNEIHSSLFMRSTDVCCGLVLNIVHISLLTHIIAKMFGYNPGEFVYFGNNVHVYKSHIEKAREQTSRVPYDFPELKINKEISSIEDIENLTFEDFQLSNYIHHPSIKYEMAI
jgi:thymidylate synthase